MKYICQYLFLVGTLLSCYQIRCAKLNSSDYAAYLEQWFDAALNDEIGVLENLSEIININDQDGDNNLDTALSCAVYCGYEHIVKFLLSFKDIDVNVQNKSGKTALHLSVDAKRPNMAKLLLTNPKLKINLQDNNGNTALIYAAIGGQENIMKLLLRNSHIDVNLQNKYGSTAFIHAACENHLDIIKLLAGTSGININTQNKSGSTALIQAVCGGHGNLVRFLLTLPGININIPDNTGMNALMHAQQQNRSAIEELIHARIDELAGIGFEAIKNKNIDRLKAVVAQIGIDKITDEKGKTFLDKACSAQDAGIIFFLLEKSRDPQELLSSFPFDQISPRSKTFEHMLDFAYPQTTKNLPIEKPLPATGTEMASDSSSKKTKKCQNCSKETILLCGKCKKVYYCSSACQKKDWLKHKKYCVR